MNVKTTAGEIVDVSDDEIVRVAGAVYAARRGTEGLRRRRVPAAGAASRCTAVRPCWNTRGNAPSGASGSLWSLPISRLWRGSLPRPARVKWAAEYQTPYFPETPCIAP